MDNVNKSRIFDVQECKTGTAPDSFDYKISNHPLLDFVLCRDGNGKPTAVYGQDCWDYNPYRLGANKMNLFRFDLLLEGEFKAERRTLVDEAKYLLFCIQYFAQAGYTGTIATSTLYGYYQVMQAAVEYCISLNSNQFIGLITLKDLFSNEKYLKSFLKIRDGVSFKKRTRTICKHLVYIGQEKIGFNSIPDLEIEVEDSEQTPIIPTRIYLSLISHLTDDVEVLDGKLDRLPDFLSEFIDPNFGRSHKTQKNKKVSKKKLQPTFDEALAAYEMDRIFVGELSVGSVKSLSAVLKSIQYNMRNALHLYTGMRNQEVMRLPYDCLDKDDISEEFENDDGETIIEKRTVKLISTTTKFAGYRKSESWYASPEAEKAIKLLQLICRGLARIHGVDPKECDLFLNPSVVQNPKNEISLVSFSKIKRKPSWLEGLVISPADFAELQTSDPERNFSLEEEFQIGCIWPLRSHQCRRSLAYYAASSGFVKLPTLKKQFKHLTEAMTRYYSRNFESINSIFGYYNEKTKEFDLPKEHIALECQSGVTTNVVDMLMNDLLLSDDELFGKTGGHIERQRGKLREGEALIETVRNETLNRVDKGELYYRKTLVGGCMKDGKCDGFMLGDVTGCITCDESSIKEHLVDIQIQQLKEELTFYNEGDGEYQITSADLAKLINYKQHRMLNKEETIA